jgi:hypothetical protein
MRLGLIWVQIAWPRQLPGFGVPASLAERGGQIIWSCVEPVSQLGHPNQREGKNA